MVEKTEAQSISAIIGRSASVVSALMVGALLFIAQETYKEFKTGLDKLTGLTVQVAEVTALLRSTNSSAASAHTRLDVLQQELRLLDNRITVLETKGK